jgi:hypothetical protein
LVFARAASEVQGIEPLTGQRRRLNQLTAIVFTAFALAFGWLIFFHDPAGESSK